MSTAREEWTVDMETVFEGECDHCGRRCPVKYEADPYDSEVNPGDENELSNWCQTCWETRKDDV